MTEVARTAVKEKVIRVIVATWKNLVDLAPQNNLSFIADSNTVECLYSIKGRKLKDDDLKTDIGELVEYIKEKQAHMSTWDFYANEIESGRLNWTPAHRDEAFWKLHAEKLDENNFRIIRGLHSILESNSDPLSVAIACNDIGQYIHFNTKGKQIIKRLGTKKLVLAHMLNEDPGVKYEALMAAQQLMKHAWEN
ncbi:H(+)-transporting V1 sector ATPase subunit H [Mycoemilia scoparia]|uniref:H(+)-transporting V1 sector ATPase subunit H n=1 Tax=Mycoemilia scoparia TaxID=417184 RepID=A0A9W7ZS00_9FUNG|nr:H(+)-transporting V1 sector ATPase subunit H [Mycoemilia scoparia]